MLTLKCQNEIVKKGVKRKCFGFLGELPSWIIAQLKRNQDKPEGYIVLKCPNCSAGRNLFRIEYTGGLMSIRVITEKYTFGQDAIFRIKDTVNQIA